MKNRLKTDSPISGTLRILILILFRRRLTGLGDWIDIAEVDCWAAHPNQSTRRLNFAFSGDIEEREDTKLAATAAAAGFGRGNYRCRDGYLRLECATEEQWRALARALGRRGHAVDVVLPFYRGLRPPDGPLRRCTITVPVGLPPGSRADAGDVATVDLVDIRADGYRLRLVDHPFSFDRPDYYVAQGVDYVDNAARFTLLGRAALEGIRLDGEPVDLLGGDRLHRAHLVCIGFLQHGVVI